MGWGNRSLGSGNNNTGVEPFLHLKPVPNQANGTICVVVVGKGWGITTVGKGRRHKACERSWGGGRGRGSQVGV